MENIIPKTSTVLKALIKADLITQWRNRRAVILVLLVPVIILITWKPIAAILGGPYVLANSVDIGLIAIGLMGYSNSIARDRDKGIFQRLRVAPLPTWAIMGSRLVVQLLMIVLVVTAVFLVGNTADGILLTPTGYIITYFTAVIGGAAYLSLGQVIVGLIKNPETVNATSRLVYFLFIITGMLGMYGATGQMGILGKQVGEIIKWSPYGSVNTIVIGGMQPAKWTNNNSIALLLTLGYTLVFAVFGIRKFQWSSK